MSLLTRLIAPLPGEVKLPVHQFMATVAENRRGAPGVNLAFIAAAFNLSPQEQTQLTNWYNNVVVPQNLSRELVHDCLMMGEIGVYSLAQVQVRLGLGP